MAEKELEKAELNEEELDQVAGGRIPDEVWKTMTDRQKNNALDVSLLKIDLNVVCDEVAEDVEWKGKVEDYDY